MTGPWRGRQRPRHDEAPGTSRGGGASFSYKAHTGDVMAFTALNAPSAKQLMLTAPL